MNTDQSAVQHSPTVALLLESDGPGGAEQVLLHHAEELRRRGYSVCPVGPARGQGWLPAELIRRGFTPELVEMRPGFDLGVPRLLREIIQRRNVSVVHSHEFSMAVYGAIAARAEGVPHIITMHGGLYFANRLRRRLALALASWTSRGTVAVSGATGKALSRSLMIPQRRIHTIPNGIPAVQGDRDAVRRELGIGQETILIVSVGNLYPVKGHRFLIQALAGLGREASVPDWKLAIAGRGEEERALRELAESGGIADRVHLLGFRGDAPNIVAAADIFVLPSLSEGLPLALLEAMIAGKPIIASGVGGIPEVVRAGEHAMLVAPSDPQALRVALETLLHDASLRERFGERARVHALEHYTIRAMVDAYERLYGEQAIRSA